MARPAGLRSPLWKRPPVFMTALMLTIAALFWLFLQYYRPIAEQRKYGPTIVAEISRVNGTTGRDISNRSLHLEVVLPDGSRERISISDFRMAGCRTGLKIEVREYRGKYVLGPNGCNIDENHTR